MGRPAMSPDAIRTNKISIIQAAIDMIRESGMQSVSARSLGAKVGINSALIYRYFKDIDEVILFACVHVLHEYLEEMVKASAAIADLTDEDYANKVYMLSWELFSKHAFSNPNEYLTLFFSRHSAELETVIKEYYELFPQERKDDEDIVLQAMFRTSNLTSRNLMLLIPVLTGKVSEQEIIMINEITIAYFYSLLIHLAYDDPSVTSESQIKRMLNACRYLARL